MKNALSKISLKAVIVGALTDVLGTNVWAVFLFLYVFSAYNLHSTPASELTTAITAAVKGSVLLNSLNWIIGGAFSVVGGFVAAKISKRDILLNATLASFLCVASGIYAIASGAASGNMLSVILALLLNPLLALSGGYIYLRKRTVFEK